MALPNPWYINQDAVHQPSTIRTLSYGMTTGTQGVWGNDDLRVEALATPGNRVEVAPGGYTVLATHLGGAYEAYGGKIDVAEQSDIISPTGSAAGRQDLVILRVENPWVSGTGSWSTPADPANGPYARIVVIEGVSDTTWDVRQYNNTWSAITLARIDRPASTGVVNPEHITNLRSIAALGGTRTVVIENPPVEVPPIAQSQYVQFNPSAIDPNYNQGGSDTTHDYFNAADTNWHDWPDAAVWQVPVPEWAREMDAEVLVMNAQILDWDVFGQIALSVDGARQTAQTFAIDYVSQPGRHNIGYGKTISVPSSWRGRVVTMKVQAKSNFVHAGRLDAKTGTVTKLYVNFQRHPD